MARGIGGALMSLIWLVLLVCVAWPVAFVVSFFWIILQVRASNDCNGLSHRDQQALTLSHHVTIHSHWSQYAIVAAASWTAWSAMSLGRASLATPFGMAKAPARSPNYFTAKSILDIQ
jgi:hypothetical protein